MAEPIIIKRYRNRKLYNTMTSSYVTLEDIAEMVREHREVRVIENDTDADITAATLAQIIFESEKRRSGFLTLGELNNIIRNRSKKLRDYLGDRIPFEGVNWDDNLLGKMYEDLEEQLRGMFQKEDPEPEDAQRLISKLLSSPQKSLEDFFDRTERKLNDSIKRVMSIGRIEQQFQRLNERLDELDAKLQEARRRNAESATHDSENGEGGEDVPVAATEESPVESPQNDW